MSALVAQGIEHRTSNPLVAGSIPAKGAKPEGMTERNSKKREEVRQLLGKIKEAQGCFDCKNKYPYYVLQFDHVYGTKVDQLSNMIKYYPIKDIFEEISKCEVVCANCHAQRSHRRQNAKETS
jgi:hypothetical protein